MMFGNRFRLISAVAVGAVAAATLMGPPAQAATSTVTGSVSSANGPVGMASVSFYEDCQDFGGTPAGSASVMGGSYSVTVPDGTYLVHIRPESPGGGIVESWHDAKPTCAQATPVTISGNGTLDLVALAGSLVTATVRFNDGQALDFVNSVQFFASCQDYLDGKPAASNFWPSFGTGAFTARVLDGSYRLLIHWDNINEKSWHGAATTCEGAAVVPINGDTTLEVTIRRGSLVTGTVSSSNGLVGGGQVSFYATCADAKSGRSAGSAWLSIDGAYSVTLRDGTYLVEIGPNWGFGALASWHSAKGSCEEAATVTVDGDRTLDLVALAGSVVTGTVSSSNGPVTGGTIEFYASCEDYEWDDPAGSTGSAGGGSYTVVMPDGTYRVWIGPDAGTGAVESWHSAKGSCEEATTVTVDGDRTLDVVALPGSEVTGTVSNLSGPLPLALVSFYASCQDYEQDIDAWFAFMTDGAYLLTVPDGTYRVQILTLDSDSGDIVESWHSAAATCEQATVVTITGDRTLNLLARGGTAPKPSPSPSASSPAPAPSATTPGTPAPSTATPLRTQKVVKPPKKLNRGKKAELARRTKQGSRVSWRTTTKKICRVTKYTVTGVKKGECRMRAAAPAVDRFAPLSMRFSIRVR